jgi:hypothetical protein
MAVEGSQWRELAVRLVADAALIGGLEDTADVPDPVEATELAEAVAVLTTGLRRLSIGVGRAYGGRLPGPVLDGYRNAVKHLADAEPALTAVADALRRRMTEPWAGTPTGTGDDTDAF